MVLYVLLHALNVSISILEIRVIFLKWRFLIRFYAHELHTTPSSFVILFMINEINIFLSLHSKCLLVLQPLRILFRTYDRLSSLFIHGLNLEVTAFVGGRGPALPFLTLFLFFYDFLFLLILVTRFFLLTVYFLVAQVRHCQDLLFVIFHLLV